MDLPEQTSAAIRRRLEAYLASTDPALAELRTLAATLQALPLHADAGACIAIRPDGELVSVHANQPWTGPVEWTLDVEPQWRAVALVRGCEAYPELAELLVTSARVRERTER